MGEATWVIRSFNDKVIRIPDATIIPWFYRSLYGKTIYVAFINNADCPNRFSFGEHPSTSKFLRILTVLD